jgi:hypothetical protein
MSSITIQTEVEVSEDDIRDALDFQDMMSLYEPDTDDACSCLDTDEVIQWAMQQPEFTDALLGLLREEGGELRAQVSALLGRKLDIKFSAVSTLALSHLMTVNGDCCGGYAPSMRADEFNCTFLAADGGTLQFMTPSAEVAERLLSALAKAS